MPGLLDSQSLLSPQEEGFARQQGFMNLAAQLMKGARYSAIPVSPFETLGEGLQGYTQGYNGAADQLMKRELLHSTIDQKRLAAIQMIGQYAGLGLPVPPLLQHMAGGAGAIGNFGNTGAPQGGVPMPQGGVPMPQGGGGMPQPSAGAPPAAPPPAGLPPGLLGGANDVAPMGAPDPSQVAGPGAPPAAPMTPAPAPAQGAPAPGAVPDIGNIIRTLPAQTRYSLATKGPVSDIAKELITKSLTPTDLQKEGAASGGLNPRQMKAAEANDKFTPDEKAAIDAGFKTSSGQPDVAGYTSALEARKGVAGAKAKYIGSLVEAVAPARETVNTLNTMEDALDRAGDKITTGPYANEMLKLKQFAQNAGIPIEGLPETEVVSKLNAYLAGQATKQISSRPAQFEFQTYLKNNPGLLNSTQGTKALINVLRQQSMQHVSLGKLAMDESNIPKWAQVEEKFYKDNPIVSPFTNKPLGTAANGGNESVKLAAPKVGDLMKGYRFKGGNPADPKAWEKAAQ